MTSHEKIPTVIDSEWADASQFSKWTYSVVNPLIKRGLATSLEVSLSYTELLLEYRYVSTDGRLDDPAATRSRPIFAR